MPKLFVFQKLVRMMADLQCCKNILDKNMCMLVVLHFEDVTQLRNQHKSHNLEVALNLCALLELLKYESD